MTGTEVVGYLERDRVSLDLGDSPVGGIVIHPSDWRGRSSMDGEALF